jgi:hypothetical protein
VSSITLSNEFKRVTAILALAALVGCRGPNISAVQAKYPDRKIYELQDGRIAINQPVGPLMVRWIDVTSTSSDRVMVDVNYKSADTRPIAPWVKLITYAQNGDILSETSVVSHTLADLQPGDVGNTVDFIPLPVNQKPVAFSLAPASPLPPVREQR